MFRAGLTQGRCPHGSDRGNLRGGTGRAGDGMARRRTRRGVLIGAGASIGAAGGLAAGLAGGRLLWPEVPSTDGVPLVRAAGEGTLNDASLLSRTPVAAHLTLEWTTRDEMLNFLRAELKTARAEGQPLCVSAARHSMGAHSIPRGGRAITLPHAPLEIDSAARTYRAAGGTRWSDAIAELDPAGLSPAVTQSNNDFGLAATFSVNAHGWAAPRGPMASTVRAIDLMLADGEVVRCTREEEADLFHAAAGGYGLIGLIVGMELEAVPNRTLAPRHEVMPAEAFGERFATAMRDERLDMAYGRLSVDREGFFDEALLVTYRPDAGAGEPEAAAGSTWTSHAASRLYRWQLGNERWKRWRWGIESGLMPGIAGGASRNSLINEPVATLDDRDPARTDILHEYFVSPERFPEFLDLCRRVIPASYQELLNITLRWISADTSATLNYCTVDRIAGVMSFSQEMTARAEADMARMTRELIDGVHAIGGAYYLPYRPHASLAQYREGYPAWERFAATKRRADPDGVLRNGFWDNYAGRT